MRETQLCHPHGFLYIFNFKKQTKGYEKKLSILNINRFLIMTVVRPILSLCKKKKKKE